MKPEAARALRPQDDQLPTHALFIDRCHERETGWPGVTNLVCNRPRRRASAGEFGRGACALTLRQYRAACNQLFCTAVTLASPLVGVGASAAIIDHCQNVSDLGIGRRRAGVGKSRIVIQ